jgi:hypothetical protein
VADINPGSQGWCAARRRGRRVAAAPVHTRDAAAAHQAVEDGAVGKVLIDVAST